MTSTGIETLIVNIYEQIKNAKFSPHIIASNTYRSANFNTTEHLNISETVKQQEQWSIMNLKQKGMHSYLEKQFNTS